MAQDEITEAGITTFTNKLRNHGLPDVADLVECAAMAMACAAMHPYVLDDVREHGLVHVHYDLSLADMEDLTDKVITAMRKA